MQIDFSVKKFVEICIKMFHQFSIVHLKTCQYVNKSSCFLQNLSTNKFDRNCVEKENENVNLIRRTSFGFREQWNNIFGMEVMPFLCRGVCLSPILSNHRIVIWAVYLPIFYLCFIKKQICICINGLGCLCYCLLFLLI